ncbi:hypothetical protein CLG96_04295 [Sphingomonas oleivorans]|uniref:DUF3489 domain-containing protein n=1 Tax=Sphingomonas oleivorans TaxID=1735121 RepID=A0A2T5G2F3_9SPHN|nr:DUF3489 domain-containing protein [Sphingomonas oleivorans]PTQ13327.1 hypothetical protein CLG96_04295 [Sphingomonas oleivorans]
MAHPKLSDIQLILLSAAALRDSGSLLPPSDTLGALSDRIRKAIGGLIRRGFAAEVEVSDEQCIWRREGDRPIGLAITPAGRDALAAGTSAEPHPSLAEAGMVATPRASTTKIGKVLALLGREQGASLAELVAATGWLPHTIRAALSGLRKKGHAVSTGKVEGVTHYRIAQAA